MRLFAQKLLASLFTLSLVFTAIPQVFAAGAITPSGGGSFTNGSTFTITVRASGATFDALQGTISVSGPVSVVSFSGGSATWLPGKSPANNSQFAGIVSATSSLTVATIKLKGTKEGTGKVTVSGVRLAYSGSEVGTGGGTTNFTITRAPTPPGGVTVSSTTHPNQEESYEATTAELTWAPPANGANGYSYLLDQTAETVPGETIKDTATSAKFENLTVGTHYFHIRANNKDGWGATTHFKINVKPKVDSGLAVPAVTSIETTQDYSNDITAGTLSGIIIKGTGPVGFSILTTLTPDPKLDPQKYPAPIVDEAGNWQFEITDPIKAGFYTLVVQGRKDAIVSSPSETVNFEVSIAEGGKVRLITESDATAAYKQAQEEARVLAAQAKKRNTYLSIGGAGVLLVLVLVLVFRRKLFAGIK